MMAFDPETVAHDRRPHALVVMGVCGAGKTEIGRRLAAALHWTFLDADDFHSPANVDKMRTGTPLVDADRWPWLERPGLDERPIVVDVAAEPDAIIREILVRFD